MKHHELLENKQMQKRTAFTVTSVTFQKCQMRMVRGQNAGKRQAKPKMPKNSLFWLPEIGVNRQIAGNATSALTMAVDAYLVDVK